MPGQQLQTTAFVLGRQLSGSDAFDQLTVCSATEGLLLCLRRVSGQAAGRATPLDLFDEAELWLESSNQGRTWFIREHRHLTRHPGIGGSYAALRAAAALAQLITRHPVPEDSRAPLVGLLRQTFGALDRGARPDLAWFKALYCLLRDEGHPVKEHWWVQLPATEQAEAARLLRLPLAEQHPPADRVAHLTRALEAWVAAKTEIRL